MKKYSDLSKSLTQKKTNESYTKYDRESFIKGELVKIGDLVEHKGMRAEVIDVGCNYATMIREGKTFKGWITEIKVLKEKTSGTFPSKIGQNLQFKGFKTTNFNEEISNIFIEKFSESTDTMAYYNCIVALNNLLNVTPNALIEYFHKYKSDFERVSRYTKKFDIDIPRLRNIEEALVLIKGHKGMQ